MTKFTSNKYFNCDRCSRLVPAFYILSSLTKGLWVQCPYCGTHAREYIPNLDLPYKPSNSYLKENNIPTGVQKAEVGSQISLLA